MSADATESQVKRLLAAGATAYVTMPLDVGLFLRVVDEALQPAADWPPRRTCRSCLE